MKYNAMARMAIMVAVCLSLPGCNVPDGPPKHGGAVVPAPAGSTVADQAPVVGTLTGVITGGNWAKGVGFSNLNIRLEVTADNGVVESLFVRSDSRVFDVSGTQVDYREAFRGHSKKVRIEYFTIMDATGGDPSRNDFKYEIGKKGVRTLHFLD